MAQESEILYEKLIHEKEDDYQLKLVVNEFRDKYYIHIRKYFLSFDDGFVPSREGVSMEYSFENVTALLDGLIEVCSKAEAIDIMTRYFGDKISDLKSRSE